MIRLCQSAKLNVYPWLPSKDPSSDVCWQFFDMLCVPGAHRFFQCKELMCFVRERGKQRVWQT